MLRIVLMSFWVFLWLSPNVIQGQDPIVLDESFGDWNGHGQHADIDDPPIGIGQMDITGVSFSSDEDFLYVLVSLTEEIDLQEGNSLEILIDVDNNDNTGQWIESQGTDLRFTFGQREGRVYLNGQTKFIEHYDIGLISLPSVESDTFELIIRREGIENASGLIFGDVINVVLRDNDFLGDRIPNTGSMQIEIMDEELYVPNYSIEHVSNDFRLISWNVLQDGLFKFGQAESIKRSIEALRPDIIAFQEIYDYDSEQVANIITSLFPAHTWYHEKINPDIITVSKYPILKKFALDGNGAFLIDHPQQEILLVNAHLPCCDKDMERQQESDKIMAFIRESQNGNSIIPLSEDTPIIIAGDMNFVGGNLQRKTLLEGEIMDNNNFGPDFLPDWDNTYFADAIIPTSGFPGAYTWLNPYSSFGPGRLDYVIYSDSQLELENGFGLNTEHLSSNELIEFGWNDTDSHDASDHFALITDFSFKNATMSDVNQNLDDLRYWPNPVSDVLNIQGKYLAKAEWNINLFDLQGRLIQEQHDLKKITKGHIELNVEKLKSGLYLLILNNRSTQSSQSILFNKI